jgi:probable DNA metabolism protein
MITQRIPRLGAFIAWRDAARQMLSQNISPEQIVWMDKDTDADLFCDASLTKVAPTEMTRVPRQFVDLASKVVAHKNPERFARLYRVLWRLRGERDLLSNLADPDLTRLLGMAKNVSRDCHKMKAFVRFRELPIDGRRRCFAAWFEPEHFIVELTGPFFARRFADMDWVISTPVGVSQSVSGSLTFHPPDGNRHAITDETENLWRTYYANIFNPARLKVNAMQSEMPKKYWKNLPEAHLIPQLVAGAEKRMQAMRNTAPTEAASTLPKLRPRPSRM